MQGGSLRASRLGERFSRKKTASHRAAESAEGASMRWERRSAARRLRVKESIAGLMHVGGAGRVVVRRAGCVNPVAGS